jgi:UDP-N-acetylmuramoyl-tripeptide--D-alanyl-D-alanine ligase
MYDFLATKEAWPYFINGFVIFRFAFLLIFSLVSLSQIQNILVNVFNLNFENFAKTSILAFYSILVTEAFYNFYKLLNKKFLKPKFTAKAKLLTLASFFPAILPPFLYLDFANNFFSGSSLNTLILAIWINTLFLGFYVAIILVIITPLDIYFKNRIFDKALAKRSELKDLGVIAVSGSYGKTGAKEFLAKILETKFVTDKSNKYENTTISCANKILKLDPKTQIFVCEVGAYQVGDGIDVCRFARPNISIITGLNNQHFGLFGSTENIIKAESESIDFLKDGEKVIINYNSELCRKIEVPDNLVKIKYGLFDPEQELDYYAKDIYFDGKKTLFTLVFDKKEVRLETNLITKGDIQNLVGAICLAHQIGVEINLMTPVIKKLDLPEGTFNVSKKDFGFLIDDTHNSNIDGIKNALDSLSGFKTNQKLVICDEIIELGKESEKTHKKLAEYISKTNPDLTIILGKSFGITVFEELKRLGYPEKNLIFCRDCNPKDYLPEIQDILNSDKTTVLCEGFRARRFLDIIDQL